MEWDAGNSTKSQTKQRVQHWQRGVDPRCAILFAGCIVEPTHEEARYLLLAVTAGGRRAALIAHVAATSFGRSAAARCRRRRRRRTMQRRRKMTGARKMKNASTRRDATLREFEKQDLGDEIASAGSAVVVRAQRPTSILLSDELKEALRRRGRELGVGYQTAAKMILAKYVNAKL